MSYIPRQSNKQCQNDKVANLKSVPINPILRYLSWYTSNNFVLATQKYPTRIGNSSATIIDHISCSSSIKSFKLLNIQDDMSDHNILVLSITVNSSHKCNEKKTQRQFIDYRALRRHFNDVPFLIQSDDVNFEFRQFHEYLLKAPSSCTKVKTNKLKYTNCYEPWMTKEFLQLCKTKNTLYSAHKKKNAWANFSLI